MKLTRWVTLAVVALAVQLFAGGPALAYGPHEGLDCLGCHDPHYAKQQKLFKVDNSKYPNPRTGKPIDGISALCLGCHNTEQYGGAGIKPIYLHMTHPVNVQPNKKIADVAPQLLRDGIIQCVSCHDPHPSNPNWRYLRVDTSGGSKVGQFCALCHGSKADKAFYGQQLAQEKKPHVFSSMNESAGAGTYALTDPKLVVSNPTPVYIQPLGDFKNSILPAYQTATKEKWVMDPSIQRIPADLRQTFNVQGGLSAPEPRPLTPATPAPAAAEPQPLAADTQGEGFFNPF